MNNLKGLLLSITILLTVCLSSLEVRAQEEKHDVVEMLDGKKMKGKVTGIGSSNIKFKYAGEDLEYEVNKELINQIHFASGRVEVFNAPTAPSASSVPPVLSSEERQNKLAVLPFEIITNDQGMMVDALKIEAQKRCADSFRKNTATITVQDPLITNSILQQNGIDYRQLAVASDPQEIALLLGVEFVVYGTSDIEYKGTNTFGSESSTYQEKEKDKNKDQKEKKGSIFSSGSSSTQTDYDTRVGLKIFSDKGEAIFSDSRRAFGDGTNSYTNSLNYMIKRTPWGSKFK
ncbi:hypothetical protein GCM10028791_02430 [Echinicola sediminis]